MPDVLEKNILLYKLTVTINPCYYLTILKGEAAIIILGGVNQFVEIHLWIHFEATMAQPWTKDDTTKKEIMKQPLRNHFLIMTQLWRNHEVTIKQPSTNHEVTVITFDKTNFLHFIFLAISIESNKSFGQYKRILYMRCDLAAAALKFNLPHNRAMNFVFSKFILLPLTSLPQL